MVDLPDHIKNLEEARAYLLRHGYSVDVANEELSNWTPSGVEVVQPTPEPTPEPELEIEEDDEEDEEWDEEDEEWDDEEEEEDDDDEEEDEE
jgi:segregation and condensation protein B